MTDPRCIHGETGPCVSCERLAARPDKRPPTDTMTDERRDVAERLARLAKAIDGGATYGRPPELEHVRMTLGTRRELVSALTQAATLLREPLDHSICESRAEYDRAKIRELVAMRDNDPWIWEEDGENNLASLSSECPILIMPRTLERLLAKPSVGREADANTVAMRKDLEDSRARAEKRATAKASDDYDHAYFRGMADGHRDALRWLRGTPSDSPTGESEAVNPWLETRPRYDGHTESVRGRRPHDLLQGVYIRRNQHGALLVVGMAGQLRELRVIERGGGGWSHLVDHDHGARVDRVADAVPLVAVPELIGQAVPGLDSGELPFLLTLFLPEPLHHRGKPDRRGVQEVRLPSALRSDQGQHGPIPAERFMDPIPERIQRIGLALVLRPIAVERGAPEALRDPGRDPLVEPLIS